MKYKELRGYLVTAPFPCTLFFLSLRNSHFNYSLAYLPVFLYAYARIYEFIYLYLYMYIYIYFLFPKKTAYYIYVLFFVTK